MRDFARLCVFAALVGVPLVSARAESVENKWGGCKAENPATAIRGCTRLIDSNALSGEELVLAYLNRGKGRLKAGDSRSALGDLNKAIKTGPASPRLHRVLFYKGLVHTTLKQYADANKNFSKAIKIQPDNAEYLFNRGVANSIRRRYRRAAADFSKTIALAPRNFEAYNARGSVLLRLRRFKAAIQDFSRSSVLKPDMAVTYYFRSLAYAQIGRRDLARKDKKRALDLNPKLLN